MKGMRVSVRPPVGHAGGRANSAHRPVAAWVAAMEEKAAPMAAQNSSSDLNYSIAASDTHRPIFLMMG
jgi:hypothetical protein